MIERAKNCNGRLRGECHPRAKLTDHEVQLMRELRVRYGWGYGRIAKKMECSKSQAQRICNNRQRRERSPEERVGYLSN